MVICFVSFCSNFVYLYIIELVILLFWIPFCMPFVVFCALCLFLVNVNAFVISIILFRLIFPVILLLFFWSLCLFKNWFPTFCSCFICSFCSNCLCNFVRHLVCSLGCYLYSHFVCLLLFCGFFVVILHIFAVSVCSGLSHFLMWSVNNNIHQRHRVQRPNYRFEAQKTSFLMQTSLRFPLMLPFLACCCFWPPSWKSHMLNIFKNAGT